MTSLIEPWWARPQVPQQHRAQNFKLMEEALGHERFERRPVPEPPFRLGGRTGDCVTALQMHRLAFFLLWGHKLLCLTPAWLNHGPATGILTEDLTSPGGEGTVGVKARRAAHWSSISAPDEASPAVLRRLKAKNETPFGGPAAPPFRRMRD